MKNIKDETSRHNPTTYTDYLVEIGKGRTLFRSYWHTKTPTEFTQDDQSSPWRFTPFQSHSCENNALIQGLYISDSPQGCLAETVFRKNRLTVVNFAEVDGRNICELRLKRDVLLLSLVDEFFASQGFPFNPIKENDYVVCTEVAKAIHGTLNNVDGLSYPSYQSNGANQNVLLFSDRVKTADIQAMKKNDLPVLSKAYRSDLLNGANQASRQLSKQIRDIISGVKDYKRGG